LAYSSDRRNQWSIADDELDSIVYVAIQAAITRGHFLNNQAATKLGQIALPGSPQCRLVVTRTTVPVYRSCKQ
jgi:hypothetical protein